MTERAIGLSFNNLSGRINKIPATFGFLIGEIHGAGMPVVLLDLLSEQESPKYVCLKDATSEPILASTLNEGEFSIRAIRDYTGSLPAQGVPMLSEPGVRAVTANKLLIANVLGDDTQPTQLLQAGANLGIFLRNFDSQGYVVKPVHGLLSKGVEPITSPAQAADRVFEDDMVVQPLIDTTRMPDGIRGIGDFYGGLVRQVGIAKELRMFANRHASGQVDLFPILRVSATPGILKDDHFAIIDPETVPQAAYSLAERTLNKIADHTGTPYLHGVVDIVWPEDEFKVMEVNTMEPALPTIKMGYTGEDDLGVSARKAAGQKVRQLLARQLIGLAKS